MLVVAPPLTGTGRFFIVWIAAKVRLFLSIMNSALIQYNTSLIVRLFGILAILQILYYVSTRLQDGVLPMGNAAFGLITYGFLAAYYQRNRLWEKIPHNQWVFLFSMYIGLSFLYGFWRFRTPTTSAFDFWLFAFIPAMVLIPPFSFRARVFDRVLAVFVAISVVSVIAVVFTYPDTLYDRKLFSTFVSLPAALGAGAGYLLLKYAERPSSYTLIGLAGVLTDAIMYGVGGSFRGRLILAGILLSLFVFILLRSKRAESGWKLFAIAAVTLSCVGAFLLVTTRLEEQAFTLTKRFGDIQETYQQTGDVMASDSRLMEYQYFMQLNPGWKMIFGHGVGGLWYDYYGMFAASEEAGGSRRIERFDGSRTMLHMNWLHVTFKIGLVGFFLLMGMLISHFRRQRVCLRQNWGWWAFVVYYCSWMTYYGDKDLNFRSMIFLIVLIHPWLFRLDWRQELPQVQEVHKRRFRVLPQGIAGS